MNVEVRRDIRFYTSLTLGFALLVLGCLLEPPGEIHNSILIGSGMILTITAGCIGIDFAKIIHELRYLKEGRCVECKEEEKEKLI